jgi:hypothetical protein
VIDRDLPLETTIRFVRVRFSRAPLVVVIAALSVIVSAVTLPCRAAPDEIQVYLDDLTKPGHFGIDYHNNYVASGSTVPEYEGAQPPNHVYRLTPELYYGLSKTAELGLYILSALSPDNHLTLDGAKLRGKYIAPHDETQGPFWGANLEIGWTDRRFAEEPWNFELKGIYGLRTGLWTFAFNLNLDGSLSGPIGNNLSLEVAFKLAYQTAAGYQVGFESYNDLGPLRNLGHLGQQSQILYAVLDTEFRGLDLNLGIGRGLTPASDRWVVKFIVGARY